MKKSVVYFFCKRVTLLSTILLVASYLNAQTVTIGAGAQNGTSSNGATGDPGPMYRSGATSNFVYSRHHYLYTQAELAAAGISAGVNLTKLAWNKDNVAGTNSPCTFQVWIKNSAKTTVGAAGQNWVDLINGSTLVYTNTGLNMATPAQWHEFNFSTPFLYTGGSIEISVNFDISAGTNPWTSDGFSWKKDPINDRTLSYCGATAPPATLPNLRTVRPQIQITYGPSGPCTNPPVAGTIVPSNNPVCLGSNFILSLNGGTNGTGQTFQWQKSPTGTGSWTDIGGATSASYNATQTDNTYYRCIVTCGSGSDTTAPLLVGLTICYCTSVTTNTADEEIYSVTVNGATNSLPCGVTAPGPGSIAYRYSNFYPNGPLTNLIPGLSVDFSIQEDECDGATYFSFGTAIWIDFNRDGDFLDAGERVFAENATAQGPRTITGNIAIPSNAVPGITGMRIIVSENSSGAALLPCMTPGFGETEDYLVNIIPPTPCNGTPNPGTATAFPTTACYNQPINLNNTGAGLGVSQVYQWQIGTSAAGPWTDISGATSFSYNTTQTATSWYRFRIICENSNDTAYTNVVQVITPPVIGGTYTINNTLSNPADLYPNQPAFKSFNDAYDAMKCGINNAVILNVVNNPAPYTEQLIMSGAIPGASATNTITFNGNGSTITFNTTAAERAVIKLRNGVSYIRFDSLVIVPAGADNGYGVHLTSDANYNIIRKCTINTNTSASTTNFAGIVISGSETDAVGIGTASALCDFNEILNNKINGGYYGITQTATFNGGAHGNNKIIGNEVKDFYAFGIYVAGTYNTQIEGNTLSRPSRASSPATVNGIYFNLQSNAVRVTANRITNPFGAELGSTNAFNGIFFNSASPSAGNDNMITNNLIYKMNGMGPINGISNTSSSNLWYYHNTISLDSLVSAGTPATRGVSINTAAVGNLFFNNNISITRGGPGTKHGIFITGLLLNCDYNNYYISAPGGSSFVGYFTSDRAALTDWQTATNHDAHSYSVNPVFVDVNNGITGYTPGNAGIDNKGFYIGVDTDILGVQRGGSPGAPAGSKPDIGAFEFIPPSCAIPPINGTTTITPAGPVCQQSLIQLNLNIPPYGSGQNFQWQSSPNSTGPWTNVGNPKLTPDTLVYATTSLYYRAVVSCGAAKDSSNPLLITVTAALPAGTYTIDNNNLTTYVPGGPAGGNFNSFADAKAAMATCGILGPVVFNVVNTSGPYFEQLKLDSIRGTSATNTITFNGNGRTIGFNAGSPPSNLERSVIKLNGADHIIFDSLVIDATGAAYAFGNGVQLLNDADSNTFRKCTILASTTATGQNFNGIVINSTDAGATTLGNTRCDGNTFDGNTIIGGYHGITVVGNTGQLINNNRITNNKVTEFYSIGIYVAGTYNTLIEGNTITRPTRTVVTTTYGIYATAAQSLRLTISKNRIHHLFSSVSTSTSPQYGIYHNQVDATAGNDNVVSNNIIYGLDGDGITYGLYNSSSDGTRYYHNTISLDNTLSVATGATRGFYQTNAAVGVEFKNNIISIKRGGTGAKHGIYLETSASEVASNNNNYFVDNAGGTNKHVAYYSGTNYTTIGAWQASGVGDDLNSFSVDPVYVDSANGNFRPGIQTIDNAGTWAEIPTDITGQIRNPSTPDIGAYEFTAPICINPPVAGTATVTPNTGICLETPIVLNLTGHSPLGTLTIRWQAAPSAAGPWEYISPILYGPQFNTVTTGNTFFRAEVICGTGTPVYSTITSVTLNAVVLAGTYTIDNNNVTTWPGPPGSNFHSFNDAVNAMLCGITGPVVFNVRPGTTGGVYNEQVRIPYIPNTSAINTVTFQSESGNQASINLTFAATSAGANYTLKLDSTKYVTFRNMTITGTNATNGRVVELANTASYNTIINCKIDAPVVTSLSNTVSGIYANAIKGTGNIIRKNNVNNGAMGIYFWGTGVTNNLTTDHIIDSNTISGAYVYGIYANYHKRAKLLSNTVNATAPLAASFYGIYAADCDSSYTISGNRININGATTAVYGIYVNNSDTAIGQWGTITSNTVTAGTGNTGALYGLYITNSPGHNVLNNVISVNTTNTNSYGLFTTNIGLGRYYNNSVNNVSPNGTVTNAAAFFNTVDNTDILIRNNIFSNKGSGRAMFINDASKPFGSNYNMLYSAGSALVQTVSPAGIYPNLETWRNTTYWDKYSIVFPPAFVSNTDLRPDIANSDVWAMHGRGVQIKGNTADFNNSYRPDSLTAGVPDLGAFEFYPTALPTLLTPIPAGPPATGLTQTFMYGTDTVQKITWGTNFPPTAGVRRYSGVAPTGLNGPDSMFFYTQVETPGNYDYSTQLFYVDPWQGSIPEQWMIGLGRTTPSNAWVVGFSSTVDFNQKRISQSTLPYMNQFTGLINPYAPPVLPDKDSSNRGRRFWVAYAINQLNTGSNQEMVLYLSATEPAQVQVKINGTNWVRNYLVPANTVLQTEFLPKNGAQNAFLNAAGLFDQGISITSDVPIVVYAHATGSASSGAAMLLPVSTWGYEYKTLGITQNYGSNSFSYFYVIADNDNTKVEITPTIPVQNAGMTPGVPFILTLNKGQVYQVVATSQSLELSGSTVRSIPNSADTCFPVAVFSGSSRTALTVPGCGSGGDFMMQQNFPATAWGKHYLTAPSSASTAADLLVLNVFRIAVKDPTTVVTRNGVPFDPSTDLVNGHYYQYSSNTADYIESDKPIMVAQFLTGVSSCGLGVGDPEMIYISPIEQGINKIGYFRNDRESIVNNLLTLIIPTNGLPSLTIMDGNTLVTPDYIYPHPQNGTPSLRGVDYSVVVRRDTADQRQVRVYSDSSFTAITYGLGSVESYGYNAGTLVKNINATGTISNTLNVISSTNDFTCAGSSFKFRATMALKPTSLTFKLSAVPNLTPNADVTLTNPVPVDSFTINWTEYFIFEIPNSYSFSAPGLYPVQIIYEHPDIEGCDHKGRDVIYVQVVPPPVTDFVINFTGCEGEQAQFVGETLTSNGIAVNQWDWTFHTGATATGQTSTFTYPNPGTYDVKLHTVTPDGCVGDNTKPVTVNPRPIVDVVQDTLAVCGGADATFTVQSPVAGVTYNWYDQPAGGTLLGTGSSYTVTNVTGDAEYYVEAVSATGCASTTRKAVMVTLALASSGPVATVSSSGTDFVTFTWTAVPVATAYEVSVNGGAYITPSSGATGLTHTVNGLAALDSVNLVVRALSPCGNVVSAPIRGCANSSATISNPSLDVCIGADATFNVQSPGANITYTWYNSLTAGTVIGTGSNFTITGISSTGTYYVEQQSTTGCVGAPRTAVIATVLPPLTQIVAVVDSVGVNTIKFRWNPIPGAAFYEVSTDGGATFAPPSSGPTGLTHTITGLQPVQDVTLIVRAIGTIACQTSTALAVTGRTLPDGIYIPNTFTPNDDGVNDQLRVYGYIIQEMHFMVYNQWGEKVFESRNQSIGWDGKHNGKNQPSGVYIYVARFILRDGTLVTRNGSINLVR